MQSPDSGCAWHREPMHGLGHCCAVAIYWETRVAWRWSKQTELSESLGLASSINRLKLYSALFSTDFSFLNTQTSYFQQTTAPMREKNKIVAMEHKSSWCNLPARILHRLKEIKKKSTTLIIFFNLVYLWTDSCGTASHAATFKIW